MPKSIDLHQLKPAFQGDIILPEHPQYASAIARWAANARKAAAAVLYVKDQDDLRMAVSFAREHGLDLAVRGKSRAHRVIPDLAGSPTRHIVAELMSKVAATARPALPRPTEAS
jgi:uncharacterized membrane protein